MFFQRRAHISPIRSPVQRHIRIPMFLQDICLHKYVHNCFCSFMLNTRNSREDFLIMISFPVHGSTICGILDMAYISFVKMVSSQLHYTKVNRFMPFLLVEILNFQGSTHRYGVGSFRTISGNPRQFNYRDESAGLCISAH